jgi:RES domain-containing protein
VILYRIATETRQLRADDLSGGGASKNPGRWNEGGQAVVYTSPSIALAVLETAAHLNDRGLPLNRFLIEVRVPDEAWHHRSVLARGNLPPTWAAIPAGATSIQLGSDWFKSGASAILEVPSVIVPEESAAVINPAHRDVRGIKAKVLRAFEYDRLFRFGHEGVGRA